MKFQCSVLFISLLLSGCAATHTLPPTELRYDESYLPPIHVMTDDPLKGGEIRNSLRATGMFSDVISGQPLVDSYGVRISVEQKFDHAPFPLVLLSAATLFLIPLSAEADSKLGFTLIKGGQVLKRYDYRNQTQSYFWLFGRGDEAREEHMRRITRSFARDAQQDGLLVVGEVVQ